MPSVIGFVHEIQLRVAEGIGGRLVTYRLFVSIDIAMTTRWRQTTDHPGRKGRGLSPLTTLTSAPS